MYIKKGEKIELCKCSNPQKPEKEQKAKIEAMNRKQ